MTPWTAQVRNSVVADGCIIEGEVENCVLFRGARVAKGASVKNCVLMQGTAVEQGVEMEYIVTDKNVAITERRHLKGNENFPDICGKGHRCLTCCAGRAGCAPGKLERGEFI